MEASRWASEYAREKTGAHIAIGRCEDVSFPEDSFDMVTLWDVVEHLEDPISCFRKVHDWLRPGGITAVTTHDIGSLVARLMGKKYPWLMRFHLYHFTPETLGALMERAGLKPIAVKYYVKTFSLRYILSRFGLNLKANLLDKLKIPIPTRDMFMIIAEKK